MEAEGPPRTVLPAVCCPAFRVFQKTSPQGTGLSLGLPVCSSRQLGSFTARKDVDPQTQGSSLPPQCCPRSLCQPQAEAQSWDLWEGLCRASSSPCGSLGGCAERAFPQVRAGERGQQAATLPQDSWPEMLLDGTWGTGPGHPGQDGGHAVSVLAPALAPHAQPGPVAALPPPSSEAWTLGERHGGGGRSSTGLWNLDGSSVGGAWQWALGGLRAGRCRRSYL